MNGDYVVTFPEAERVYASEDGQDFETQESPDHTLVYNAVYQSCRDLTACGSWDEIHSSTPNRKSKPIMHGMHLKNLSTTSIQSIIEYVPSCLSDKEDEHVLSHSPPECIPSSATDIPNQTIPKIYPPDALLTNPDQHLSPSIYIPLTTLGRNVYGKVFAARLKDDPNDKIYTLKTIPNVNLGQRGVAEVTKELEILRFITDASLSNKPFPFLQKLKENFQDDKNIFIVLEYFPTTLANAETAKLFRLSQKPNSPSKTYESEEEAATIQGLRLLAAELTLGLLFLHRHGIVHQDVKPANIMISEGGHAVIGEFGAASTLPTVQVLGHKTGDDDDPFERPSCIDEDGAMVYISIVLRPEDTVTFTALYAAPELLERKGNGSLIYDERVDWWSLGISLYEITTGGIPFHISSEDASISKGRSGDIDSGNGLIFDLLDGLNLTRSTTRACDAHLDGYLRSLLVHDPRHRLSGERAKSHPFLEPLNDIWEEIEDLKHPPCPKPSARVPYYGEGTTDISFDLPEDSSKFDAESPQTPLQVNEEYYTTAREVFSSPEQISSLESPPFSTRRREALEVKRPGGQMLRNDRARLDGAQKSGSSVILQKEAFMSYYIETSFQTNGSFSVVGNPQAPLPSSTDSDSAGRVFSNDENFYGTCTIHRRLDVGTLEEEQSFDDEDKVRAAAAAAEISFTDSGLDFPLGASPESWGRRKSDSFRKPLKPIQFEQRLQGLGLVAKDNNREGRAESLPAKPKEKADFLSKPDLDHCQWTFDEKITISLLEEAGSRQRRQDKFLEPTVTTRTRRLTRLSKPQLVAAASERIMKAAGRRVVDALRRTRRQ